MPRVRSMPSTAYNRVVSTIRDYPRIRKEYERLRLEVGAKATTYDEMPKGTEQRNEVEEKAIRLADLENEIATMQELIDTIPQGMREGILNNIYYGNRFPPNEWGLLVPSLRQWQREKELFIVRCAHRLHVYRNFK